MTRLEEKWGTRQRIPLTWTPEGGDEVQAFIAERSKHRAATDHGLLWNLMELAKEVIFDVRDDGSITLSIISLSFDGETIEVIRGPIIDIECDNDELAKTYMAFAVASEVPIVPNRDEVLPRLQALYDDLMRNGFTASMEGKSMQLRLATRGPIMGPKGVLSSPVCGTAYGFGTLEGCV